MPAVARDVMVEADLDAVARYLAHVPNLATWTNFFVEVGPERDGRYAVRSIVGAIETWIESVREPGGTRLTICSLVGGRVETATLEVREEPGGVAIRFVVTLPGHLGDEAVAEQHTEMGEELTRLKGELEGQRVGA